MSPRWRISRRWTWITALAAALVLAGLFLYRQFGPSPLEPCANDPALVNRIIRETAKAAARIRNGQGELTYYEWQRGTGSSTSERKAECTIEFCDDRFRFSSKDTYNRWTKPHRSARGRVQRAVTQMLNPCYSNWVRDDRVVTFDGRCTLTYLSSRREALVHSANCGCRGLVLSVFPLAAARTLVITHQHSSHWIAPVTGRPVRLVYSEPTIVGRQVVDGAGCLVVEQSEVLMLRSRPLGRATRFWVCPKRGYSILREEVWGQNPARLWHTQDVRMRPYGHGLWVPVRIETRHYDNLGNKQYGVTERRVATLDPAFQVNLPARELHLSLRLPRGTKVHDEVLKKDYVVK